MDGYVAASKAKKEHADLVALAKKLDGSDFREKAGKMSLNALEQVLASKLNPQQHSLGYARFLAVKAELKLTEAHLNTFLHQATELFSRGDAEQLKLAGKHLAAVSGRYAATLEQAQRCVMGVVPLQRVVNILTEKQTDLITPVHADLLLCCILSKHYNKAARMLNGSALLRVDPKATGMTEKDYLRFWYYAGMVRIGTKNFAKAAECFLQALTAPTAVASQIQMESFKKYTLCCLLVHGEAVALPDYKSPIVERAANQLCRPYVDLARAYKNGAPEAFMACVDANQAVWAEDTNLGLVKQTQQALVTRNIQRLTNTYVALSLAQIAENAQLASPKEAEQRVQRMMLQGDLFAKISQQDGTIRFLEDSEAYDSTEQMQRIDAKIREVAWLQQRVDEADRALRTNQNYLRNVTPVEQPIKNEGADAAAPGHDRDMELAMQLSRADM